MIFRYSIEGRIRHLDKMDGNWQISQVNWRRLIRLTVEKKTMEGFLDLKLCIEDDKSEGYGEDVVTSSALEVGSEHVEGIVVTLLDLDRR